MSSVDGGAGQDGERVIDLDRMARPGDPPVPGAQWDEVHGRWERWDDQRDCWEVVSDAAESQRPAVEGLVPAPVVPEPYHGDALAADEEADHIVDIDRIALPERPVPGAQWNEVVGRWEVWSEAAGAWVDVSSQPSARQPLNP